MYKSSKVINYRSFKISLSLEVILIESACTITEVFVL